MQNKKSFLIAATAIALTLVVALPTLAAAGKVNINTASSEQLMLLPRVGPSLAERIVEYRERNGSFEAPEELMLVRGIGEATYARMEPHVAVSGETSLSEKVPSGRRTSSAPQED